LFINLSSLFSHILFAFSSGYPWRYISGEIAGIYMSNRISNKAAKGWLRTARSLQA
jgi:hypothetical protein